MPGITKSREAFTSADTDLDRVQASLSQDLMGLLNPRGYVLMARGATGMMFRRELSREFLAGLALVGIGLFFLLLVEVWWMAAICLIGGAALVWLRKPGTILVQLRRSETGTNVTVTGPHERGMSTLLNRHSAQTVLDHAHAH